MKHYSFSAISAYLRCGRKYQYHYINKLPYRTNESLAFGSSVHAALGILNKAKMDGYEIDLPALIHVQDEMLEHVLSPLLLSSEEVDHKKKCQAFFLSYYHFNILPDIDPVLAEKILECEIPNRNFGLKGIPDLVTENTIWEFKTSGKSPSDNVFKHSLQLCLNSFLVEQNSGFEFRKLKTITFVTTKTPKVVIQENIITQREIHEALETFILAIESIEKKCFPKTDQNINPMCTKETCEFYTRCKIFPFLTKGEIE